MTTVRRFTPRGLGRVSTSPALRRATRSSAFERTVTLLEHLDRSAVGGLAVLTYHRVTDGPIDGNPALVSASVAEFRRQVEHLAEHATVVSMREVLAARRSGRLPPRAVLLTFDDAYACFAQHAWPIIREAGLSATLFVPTAFAAGRSDRFWWDTLYRALSREGRTAAVETPVGRLPLGDAVQRQRAHRLLREWLKTLPAEATEHAVEDLVRQLGGDSGPAPAVLRWPALRRLSREGVVIAAHSRTHPMLDRVHGGRLTEEIEGSLADVERELGAVPRVFAYPSGQHDDEVVAATRRAGVELAFTTRRGVTWLEADDPLRLRRINVGSATTLPVVRAQLLPSAARLYRRIDT
jgi:peptidoglycan/xylan/chitin deacetylase (PgdA/CDA1 family)